MRFTTLLIMTNAFVTSVIGANWTTSPRTPHKGKRIESHFSHAAEEWPVGPTADHRHYVNCGRDFLEIVWYMAGTRLVYFIGAFDFPT